MLLELRARLLRGEVDAVEAEELLRDTVRPDPSSRAGWAPPHRASDSRGGSARARRR
jgi:hypothetical protein